MHCKGPGCNDFAYIQGVRCTDVQILDQAMLRCSQVAAADNQQAIYLLGQPVAAALDPKRAPAVRTNFNMYLTQTLPVHDTYRPI